MPKNEPKPDEASTVCPRWIIGTAREKWKEPAPRLKQLGLLTALDLDQLAAYCESWAEFRHAKSEIRKLKGDLIQTVKGSSYRHPYWDIAEKAWARMLKIGAQFGFKPVSRADIEIFQEPEESDKIKEPFG